MRKLLFFFLTIICICSCKPTVKKLGANPKVSYYIVGRLKTHEITEGIPFEAKVLTLNSQLIEKPITLKIESPEKFSLIYSLNDKTEKKECTFGKEIDDNNMQLLITKVGILNGITAEELKNIDYQFQVKGEE